ncbi:MAG: hypothetical protein ACRCT1_00255 [Microcoleaceae cyanobacterium]
MSTTAEVAIRTFFFVPEDDFIIKYTTTYLLVVKTLINRSRFVSRGVGVACAPTDAIGLHHN